MNLTHSGVATVAKPLSGFSYSDVNRLGQIKTQGDAGIRAAAQQFESLFIDMMMTSMRQAGAAFADKDYTSSDATRMQQDMLDHQWAVHIAENGGVGLADVVVRQLSGTLNAKHAATTSGPRIGTVGAAENPAPAPAAAGSADPVPALFSAFVAPEWAVDLAVAATAATKADPTGAPPSVAVSHAAGDDPMLMVTTMGSKDGAFEDPEDFVAKVLPVLKNALAGSGLNPLLVLAQGALETGWGAHVIHSAAGDSSHNLFNIKASSSWQGPTVEVATVEYHGGQPVQQRDRFRAYDSIESAVRDYLSLLTGDRRYQQALDAAKDPARFADELQKAGYATDPNYASKIIGVLTSGPLRAALGRFGG